MHVSLKDFFTSSIFLNLMTSLLTLEQACHLFLMNVLKDVMHLVKLDSSATCGEALGIVALQMLAVLLSDVRHLNR